VQYLATQGGAEVPSMRNSQLTPEQVRANVITLGRAYVRLVEAVGMLLERKPFWTD